jgi:serine O-acetyltransferase
MWLGISWLVRVYPEFRNLLYFRVQSEHHLVTRLILILAKIIYRPLMSLYIFTSSIGPGLFIQHGFSTVIAAKSIGSRCWINQQVTIGHDDNDGRPTIGANVRIGAGAIVFGDISIGDNCEIGANAVVNKSVPPDCTVVGVPGRIVRRNGIRLHDPERL